METNTMGHLLVGGLAVAHRPQNTTEPWREQKEVSGLAVVQITGHCCLKSDKEPSPNDFLFISGRSALLGYSLAYTRPRRAGQ